jgi:hypothetical protein
MGSTRNILYGLVATLVSFSVAVAIQQRYVSHGDSEIAAAQPERDSKPGLPATSAGMRTGRGPAGVSEGDDSTDAASDEPTVGPSKRVGPARSENSGNLGSQSAAPQDVGSLSRNEATGAVDGWVDRIAAAPASESALGSGAPAAPSPSPAPSEGSTVDQPQVRDVFFSRREDTACQPGDRQFTLEDVQGLYACVVWAGLAGSYAQQLAFVSPDGQVYQTLTQAFATSQAPASGTVEVDGRQYAVKRAGWGATGETLVTAVLPVAGTYITKYNIAGLWTVKVSLNGEVLGQQSFELRPR